MLRNFDRLTIVVDGARGCAQKSSPSNWLSGFEPSPYPRRASDLKNPCMSSSRSCSIAGAILSSMLAMNA